MRDRRAVKVAVFTLRVWARTTFPTNVKEQEQASWCSCVCSLEPEPSGIRMGDWNSQREKKARREGLNIGTDCGMDFKGGGGGYRRYVEQKRMRKRARRTLLTLLTKGLLTALLLGKTEE